MQIKNSLLIACLLLMIGCKDKKSHLTEKIDGQDTMKVLKKNSATVSKSDTTESIVISCGSGCAISYSPKTITRQNESIKVVFKADMYEDEILTDSYDETYLFYYTGSQKLDKIVKEGEKVDFLQTQMSAAQRAFIEFGEHLVTKNGATNPDIGVHTGNGHR